jgi:class 3 adenylate cyclase
MQLVSETFGRYVPAAIRDHVRQGRVPLDGAIVDVAILTAGIRHFDRLVESLPPARIVRIMNTYFEFMASVIRQKNGLLLRIVDGGIHVVFGAPMHDDQCCRNALEAALLMRKAMNEVNDHLREGGLPEQTQQIGIHAGMAVAANIGSSDRLTYSVIGKTVARASLIRNYCETTGSDILASAIAVKDHARDVGARPIEGAVSFLGTPETLFTLEEPVGTKN